jgi:hypothetical protein
MGTRIAIHHGKTWTNNLLEKDLCFEEKDLKEKDYFYMTFMYNNIEYYVNVFDVRIVL